MRRIQLCLAVVAMVAAVAYAGGFTKLSFIGPATASSSAANANHANGTADVTIAAGSAGVRNCLDTLDVIGQGNYIVRVLDGGTTIYQLTMQANQGLVRDWSTSELGLCGSSATAMRIKVTTSTAGNFDINYRGYTY